MSAQASFPVAKFEITNPARLLSAPKSCDSYIRLGNRFYSRGNLNNAFFAYQMAAQVAPRMPDGYYGMNRVQMKIGDVDSAHKNLELALTLCETCKDYELLGYVYAGLGNVFFYMGEYITAAYYSSLAKGLAEDKDLLAFSANIYNLSIHDFKEYTLPALINQVK